MFFIEIYQRCKGQPFQRGDRLYTQILMSKDDRHTEIITLFINSPRPIT